MEIFEQLSFFDMMSTDSPREDVAIEGVINLRSRPISEYKVRLSYGDLVLIISMLRDYIKGFDAMAELKMLPIDKNLYEHYYRVKFLNMANRIQEQIEYDYDEKMKQCLKKMGRDDNSDIGDEAMSLMIKKAQREFEAKQKAELMKVQEDKNDG